MNNEKRWKQRFENFEKSFNLFCRRHKEYEENQNNEAYQLSLIQSYEILMELTRNTLKDYLENAGSSDLETIKKIIRKAFQSEIISDAEAWMEAFKNRNRTSHVYHSEILKEVIDFINDIYFPLVRDLYYNLKQEINASE